ncbi:LuxR C-terminal-related transcriptional regulator [Saccharopolyspora phatthalungensis]|uniref:Non-specific serine/threonine protein kinase n=1 Tax=Saccharopolyspora phatthalungensis TaxID=664693 RepID=A0A840Q7D8_9PSEU|nr:LuxR C-terminal-related transcriptional regulator [Saccharopolyspora phatthalungensis]MBB5155790.1 non-specific serine/threonine protein kinase [Saccharopolyspora phatthalungensis]
MVSTVRARVRESTGNLPADVTSFVGRRREITLTKRLLAESRVVTLTGPGGVGKTRLAMRVAGNMRRSFRDKAWCVELEDVRDGSLVVDAVIEQLGIGGPSTGQDVDTVIEQLRSREMLLVLDNCEHVVEDVALLVDSVVRWCPGVRVLATSRQSLGAAGEATMVVPPLQVPDIEHLPPPEAYEQFASVRLFVERAKAAVPEFEITSDNATALMRLCYRLDGNPLAIELAAVRLRSLSLQQLEQRISERYDLLTEGRRGAPPRQQTLRALIDWSYELVSDQDRLTWARVSVFSGSFDLAAAEHVIGTELSDADVLGAMHSLVDKSVLMREEEGGEVRFRLPHILREYGQDKLVEFGELETMLQRHCAWYADLAARFAAEWIGPDQIAWVGRLRSDQGNLRVALGTAAASPRTAGMALRISTDLWQYWGIRGLNGEARHWLDEVLASTPPEMPERVRALRVSAWFALLQGDLDTVTPMLEQATVLATQRGEETEKAYLALVRGLAAFFLNDSPRAAGLVEEALSYFRKREVLVGELFALYGLGLIKGLSGDHETGLSLLSEGIRLTAERGELYWRSYELWASAQVEVRRGEPERAEAAAKEALRLQRQLDNRLGIAFNLDTLAWIAQRQGRNDRAARLFGAASALWEAVRAAPGFWARFAAAHDEHEAQTRAALGDEAFQEAFDRGRQLSLTHTIDFALEVKRNTRARTEDNVHPMPLTRRERQIAELVAQGHTNKEIAENLVIAQRTVEGHVQNILTKLDFTSRAQIGGWVAALKSGDENDTSPNEPHFP